MIYYAAKRYFKVYCLTGRFQTDGVFLLQGFCVLNVIGAAAWAFKLIICSTSMRWALKRHGRQWQRTVGCKILTSMGCYGNGILLKYVVLKTILNIMNRSFSLNETWISGFKWVTWGEGSHVVSPDFDCFERTSRSKSFFAFGKFQGLCPANDVPWMKVAGRLGNKKNNCKTKFGFYWK